MKELEKEFDGSGDCVGFKMTQLLKTDKAYLYDTTDEFGVVSYEVFERRESKDATFVRDGIEIIAEAKVKYPKSHEFGLWAFCFRDLEKAKAKLVELSMGA
jgi:hypothetical protein